MTTEAMAHASAQVPVTVDLTNCDREPIHIPGSIQPHGVLLAFVEPAMTIVSASANCGDLLGVDANELVGRTLSALLAPVDLARVADPRGDGPSGLDAMPLATSIGGRTMHWTMLVHRGDGLAILELEPVNPPRAGPSTLLLLSATAQRLQATTDLVGACQAVCEEIRRITGFARVKLYRFAADWSGEVLAESRDDDMPSYRGLHFPSSDIPVQARALYRSNPVRLIADVGYAPSPLVPDRDPGTGGPIDLRVATLRSVSPIHLEYLRNMGVGASMSASILRNGTLWGLIACHHRAPLLVDFERRQACALVAQFLAARLDVLERTDRARRSVRVESLRADTLRAMADGQSLDDVIAATPHAWLQLVDAAGFALVRSGRVVTAGRVPEAAFIDTLTAWLVRDPDADHVAVDRLGSVLAIADPDVASGVLAVPLSRADGGVLLWFRPELLRDVTWAGRPGKTAEASPAGRVLHPRLSFDAWTETVRGRSAPWTDHDVAAALQLREVLLEAVVREKDALEQEHLKLVKSTRELETFIYVASHDIKEPLRQMEMLASLLREHVKPGVEAEVADYFREFKVIATRLRVLTDQLADYARLGRVAPAFTPVALDDVVEEALAAIGPLLDAAGGTVDVHGPLPTVLGERAQLHQVFVNLLGNSIKYRATDRSLRIRVDATVTPDADPDFARGSGVARVAVADNGIGFEPRYADKVFEAFWRLHPRDRYEGSGIGLAICRRIVERHGGRIEAKSAVDRGATFLFTLPVR